MSKEKNPGDREQWATPEEIERGRAAVLEKLGRIRQWLAESPPDVLEDRLRHEWLSEERGYCRYRPDQWRAAKAVHESDMRDFARAIADGWLISKTIRGMLKGKPLAAPDDEDEGLPF
jgi:hypothetical protein